MKRFLIFLCLLVCTACMPPEKILERQGISTIVGYDLFDKDTFKGTISLLQFDRKEEETSVTISAEGSSSKQIRQRLEQKTSHDLASGQLRTILFNKNLTKKEGIGPFLDTMQRDRSIGSLVFLAITNNAEKTISNENYEEFPEMGSYIYQLLYKHKKKEMLTSSNIHDFISALYEVGIDPTLPIISNKPDVAPYINGVALFKDDQMAGSISLRNTMFIKLFTNKNAFLGDITLKFPTKDLKTLGLKPSEDQMGDHFLMIIRPIKYRGHIDLSRDNTVYLNAAITVSVVEVIPSISMKDKQIIHRAELMISEALNKEFSDVLQKFKELNTDPIGIGRALKTNKANADFTDTALRKKYSDLKIIPNIKVIIKRTGAAS
ncbi:Ger(x)C family spore germination protein [Bacillus massiliglaciei]|uniref:Ger(x)C family spore germination protein n=1 Tax=Bacillus massiliglaciei TaxID=1816693 RepID=UPI000DA6320B|nr:Ger(x)C family spore germination protein [Bacillus massiliglaciei]